MSRYHSYINSAIEILKKYAGEEPFASFLKKYFSTNKKYGSKDRKQISHLCYCYFRIGRIGIELPADERILMGLFLCADEPNEILEQLKPEWSKNVLLPVTQKILLAGIKDPVETIFHFADELSNNIDKERFILSYLQQPDVFLRLRPGKEEDVKRKLKDAGIEFEAVSNNCLALPNSSKADSAIELDKEAVVQDYSSQRVGELVSPVRIGQSDKVWDCCAGSGGKSIMLYDLHPGIDLTVSDIRESILINLKKRFSEAGISRYKTLIADLAHSPLTTHQSHSGFRLILADIPCSGSGTWGRTPEQLYYFKKEKINEYVSLQKKIISNVIPHLQPCGYLLYVTCSGFKKENEDMVEFIKQNFRLQLIKMEVLKGYDKKADTMFAALLQKV